MEKDIRIHLVRCDDLIPKNKNIFIKTKNYQLQCELASDEVAVKKEVEGNSECFNDEFTDFEHNIDKSKHYNKNFCITNGETKIVNQSKSIIKIEEDVTNDYVYETELEIEIPTVNTQQTEINILSDCNTGDKIYQCNICHTNSHDNINLEASKLSHEYTKKFKCSTCSEKFLELSCLKIHLLSHIDDNIKLLENEFGKENENEKNSHLCNNITMIEELKTRNSDGVQIKKEKINYITITFSVEIENSNIQNCVSTIVNGTDSQKCIDTDLTVENSVDSVVPVKYKPVSLDKSCNTVYSAISVDPYEYISDEMFVYECAKCTKLFHNRSSIKNHLKNNTNHCINCCKYIGSKTLTCKFPIKFQPGTPVYFECNECYNGFYTLKKFRIYHSATSKKTKAKPYKCDVCLQTYINYYHFAAHQRLHKGERPYQCNICNKRFHARFNLEAHMFSHPNIKRYECFLCLKEFLNISYLKLHLLSHNDSRHVCNICLKEFESLSSLRKHQDLHPRYKPHKCVECGKSFSLFKSFQQHLKRHSGLKPYKCPYCDESCSTYFEFKSHKRQHNGDKPYKCDICKDVFDCLNHWKTHRKTHYENKMFECNMCHKKFGTKNGVKYHLNTHSQNIRNYECKVCHKKFQKKYNLNEHEKIHSNLKPYVCNICKKSFISRYNFTHHINQHTGARPFKCEFCSKSYPAIVSLQRHKKNNHTCDFCNKFYADPTELKNHRNTHEKSKLKLHVCQLCEKRFSTLGSLNIHKLSHLEVKPFKCDLCPMSYVKNNNLATHRRKHTGERPYKCDLCNKSYPQISSLRRHQDITHK